MDHSISRPPPAIDIVESEEILHYLSPALLKTDYTDGGSRAVAIGASFMFFTAIFLASVFISNQFPVFRALKLKVKIFMSLGIARGIFGVFATFVGCYAVFKTTNLDRDVVFGTNATSSVAMLVTLGFFLFELSAVAISDIAFKSFSKLLLAHHGLALIAYSIAISLNANFSFGCKGLLLEMSTPFSCLSYVLLKAGMENSLVWKINQFILIHTFHLRSVLECHLWYITYNNWLYITEYMPWTIFVLLYLNLTLITFVMTPYWGYKKTQQLFRPVDWNIQESQNADHLTNGNLDCSSQEDKKVI